MNQNTQTTRLQRECSKWFGGLLAAALCAAAPAARAASGTWTNDASSIWGDGTNWLNGTVADGVDATADFSTINITANRTNTLDTSRTIGNLSFGDTNGTQLWLLNSSGGSVLTLATSSGTPTITTATNGANTFVAAINVPLAGTGGLTKAGNGILALGGTNTYTGQTTVSGGTLAITNGPGGLQSGSGSLVAYYSFNNVAGNRVLNEGSGGALMDGMLVGNGGVSIGAGMGRFGDNCLNVTQGAVNNNANFGAMGNGGYMLVNNPVVPFTCTSGSAAANWSWALWIKTTTQGAGYMYQGNNGWASGNTAFYLTTGASVTGGGINAAGVRNSQGWQRGTAVINDGNWHHLAMTCNAGVKTLYVDGAVDAWQVNGWTGAGVGNQLWIGGTGGTFGDGNVQMTGLIDKVAIYNRPLTLAEVRLLTNNIVPGVAAPAIPLNSPVSIAVGAKLDANGYYATVTNLTGSGFVDSVISGGYVAANYGSDTVFNGIITNSGSSTLNFYKLGSGKMTVAGLLAANNVVVRQGTLTTSGSGLITTNGANNTITVADGTEKAILDIPSGSTVVARNLVLGGVSANANGGGGAGAVYNRGTYRNFGNTGTGAFALGNATGGAVPTNNGYGYFLQDSATPLNLGESGVGGQGGGDGVFEVKSGTANFTNWITMGRSQGSVSGQQQRSLMLVRGGTVNGPNFNNEDRWNWSGSTINFYTVMDISAGGTLDSLGTLHNINMGNDNNANAISILTIDNGGFVHVNNINAGAANPNCTVNFNNAVLAPTVATTAFLGANLDNVFVYSGGVTFSNNLDIGSVAPLKAPTDSSITSIPVTDGGSGYIGRPIVQITDAVGVGATAIAEWDQNLGTVTGITITSPGSGYYSPTVTLVGGGATVPATLGSPVLGTAVSGGLTKTGTGTLTLSGGYTYTGDTVIQAGTISVSSGVVTPVSAGSLSMSNDTTLTLDLSSATSLPVANLTLQNNVTNNFNYGNLSANPTFAAINASGSIAAPGANIVLNVSAVGLQPGTFTLIKYTGAPLGSIANFSVTLPPGVNGALVNNTANDSIDLNIASTPNVLSWNGVSGTNWDLSTVNWSNVFTTAITVFRQYTNGSVIAGDSVIFEDTVTNDFVNPQPTNINLTANFYAFPVTVNSTLPYSIGGAGGIAGSVQLLKTNSGSLTLLTSNSFTGGVNVGGGTLVITNDTALGASSGVLTLNGSELQVNGNTTNNARALSIPAAATIGVLTNTSARFGGTVTGSGSLTKTDVGSLTLAGNDTATGALIVNQGILNTLGTDTLPGVVTVGNTGGQDAILNVGGGTLNAVNNGGQFSSSLVAGSAGGSGDVRLSAGTLTVFQQLGLGSGNGGYAGFNMTGGTLTVGSYIVVGFNNDNAVFNQSAGTTTVTTNLMTIAAGGSAGVGVANLTGGTFISTDATNGNNGGRGGIFIGENGTGTLNVSGSATVTATGQANLTMGRTGAASSGTVNLLGGTVNTLQVSRGAGSATLNFNGGVLKATGGNANFINGLNAANVYNGGAIIDDGGFNITIPQALQAPNGFGVATIPVVAGTSSGYIDTPVVTLSGGNGSNAMATATVSGGQITGITITCPGSGYQNTDVLNVSFTGGGANAVPPQIGTMTFVANGTGGLTKRGTGTLTLSGVNTFTGPITNSAGTLSLNSASTYAAALVVNAGTVAANTSSTLNGSTIVTNGATLTITQLGSATNKMSDLTLNGTATLPGATLGLGLTGQNPTTPLVNCGVLTANGTNTIGLSGAMSVGAIPLIKYASLVGTITNLTLPQGVVGSISNSASDHIIYALITSTGPGLVWTGTNSGTGLTNLWDIASTTNWLLGATATTYRQPIIPGDAVTFNDVGSGTVILNTNAGPSSVTISNNAINYTISGRGNLTGSGGITKLGTGTAILSLTNDNYTGDTTISNGVLQVGTTTALSSASSLNIGASGTLELPGFSQTVNNLSGQGTVDNNTSTNVTLTVNNGGTWNGTIHDQGAGGGVSLTKIGNGTLVVGGSNYLTSTTASQVNAGLAIVTNGGSITCSNSEYWVGATAGLTATNIVDGGTVATMNNFLVIGRGSATANGTLIVNSGTVQKAGANVIVVGSLGATGTLIVNGGQVLNNSELWLGENATAVATLYLNGGLLQATDIRANGTFPTVQPSAYFNGGVMQASGNSANFLQVNSYVMSNGMVFDDNGYTDTIALVPLVPGDSGNGGLIKKGSGTLYLDNFNTYTGATLVTNGMLAGIGGVAGNLIVAPNGNLGAGNATHIATFTISGSLDIQGTATVRVDKTGGGTANDQIAGYTSVHFGGVLVVTNATSDATPITTSDTFQIFSAGGTGNFTSIVGSPGPGLAYSFNPATGVLSVVSVAPAISGLAFTGTPVISGTSLTISGTNAGAGSVYLLTSTNITSPLSTWLPVWTNVFAGDSSFTTNIPNAVDPTLGKQFYILGTTHN